MRLSFIASVLGNYLPFIINSDDQFAFSFIQEENESWYPLPNVLFKVTSPRRTLAIIFMLPKALKSLKAQTTENGKPRRHKNVVYTFAVLLWLFS